MSQPAPSTDRPAHHWRVTELLAWLALMAIWTAAWSWVSVLVAEYRSPPLLFPILSGIVFGLGGIVAMRITGLASRRWLVAGTAVFAMALVVGHHYVGYRLARLATERQQQHLEFLAAFPSLELNFARFLRAEALQGRPWFWLTLHGPWAWASWGADGLLELAAATIVVSIAARQAFCSQCRTWYRTIRSGSVDAAATAALAEVCGSPAPSGGVDYRIAQCRTGCGQPRLELIDLGTGQPIAWAWLDREQAERVRSILDPAPPGGAGEHANAAASGGGS
jgi:hypothetical protein